MTNLEALIYNLADTHGFILNEGQFQKSLIDVIIDPEAQYSVDNAKPIDIATVKLYEIILGAPNMQEGDINYSITNKEYFEKLIDNLLNKWGQPSKFGRQKPTVTGASPW